MVVWTISLVVYTISWGFSYNSFAQDTRAIWVVVLVGLCALVLIMSFINCCVWGCFKKARNSQETVVTTYESPSNAYMVEGGGNVEGEVEIEVSPDVDVEVAPEIEVQVEDPQIEVEIEAPAEVEVNLDANVELNVDIGN